MRVVLIGESTAGKSTIGPDLARELGVAHVDLDSTIAARHRRNVAQLFADYGAEGYQRLNEEVLTSILHDDAYRRAVVVAGSFTPRSRRNRVLLAGASTVLVHLHVTPAITLQRLAAPTSVEAPHAARALLGMPSALRSLSRMYQLRRPYYSVADATVETDGKTPRVVLQETLAVVREQLRCQTGESIAQPSRFDRVYSRAPGELYYAAPSSRLHDIVQTTAAGRALDLGCGDGRNALYLACCGWTVEALDISQAAIRKLTTLKRSSGLATLRACRADLVEHPIAMRAYDLIVATTILDHVPPAAIGDLVAGIMAGLKPGGHLFASVFTTDDPGAARASSLVPIPMSETADLVQHYFAPDELRSVFRGLEVVAYAETSHEDVTHGLAHAHATAKLIARRPLDRTI